jgi:N-acetylmuramoyl-L-alanine amidase
MILPFPNYFQPAGPPSILVENFFMDSHPDYDFLLSESGQQAIRQSSR